MVKVVVKNVSKIDKLSIILMPSEIACSDSKPENFVTGYLFNNYASRYDSLEDAIKSLIKFSNTLTTSYLFIKINGAWVYFEELYEGL